MTFFPPEAAAAAAAPNLFPASTLNTQGERRGWRKEGTVQFSVLCLPYINDLDIEWILLRKAPALATVQMNYKSVLSQSFSK